MAHTNVRNTFVGTPQLTGGIWRFPQSVTLPTDAFTVKPTVGGQVVKPLGGVSDDGVTWMSKRNTTPKYDWNGSKVRSIQSTMDDSFKITYIEFVNPLVLAEVYGTDNVTVVAPSTAHGTQVAVRQNANVLGHYSYIIDTLDGPTGQQIKKRRVIADAQVDNIEDVVEKPGDWSVFTVTYNLFPDSQGNTSYIYYELSDKVVPSVWDSAVTGSAGTQTYTVDGQSTSALAYNVAPSALDTAIEALTTVGTGNATVTGSAGAYHITLANGGVLSAVGAGGATVAVTPSS